MIVLESGCLLTDPLEDRSKLEVSAELFGVKLQHT
jgi:hypothetical protein